ncbi:hypothetical protein PIB30_027093 [Stylosanthes scabra]|uniref:Uncharacterized protein n=1 Tax=Stylosanthes scabra TaxID=79078 RepID=A0ABU6VBF9_9FABA|nr:hypothetical protein [Stylosanthes scabra]
MDDIIVREINGHTNFLGVGEIKKMVLPVEQEKKVPAESPRSTWGDSCRDPRTSTGRSRDSIGGCETKLARGLVELIDDGIAIAAHVHDDLQSARLHCWWCFRRCQAMFPGVFLT